MQSILVTGGAGFIGSCLVRNLIRGGQSRVITLDKLTYAGSLEALAEALDDPRHTFVRGDIADEPLVARLLEEHRPAAIVNLAAETHVDRSIDSPASFVDTNVVGAYRLLEVARRYWRSLDRPDREAFRFLQVSTDEVFGSVPEGECCSETAPLAPSSPYAASKAAADGFARAYHRTYGVPTMVTYSSNNFGPFQFPEKLVPLVIRAASEGRPLPLYGDGLQLRSWLNVEDQVEGFVAVLERGRPGEAYNLGGNAERTNLQLVEAICHIVDKLRPQQAPAAARIEHVADRPGHDRRYALDSTKALAELGWQPQRDFDESLRDTVRWYLEHGDWIDRVAAGVYRGERLGLGTETRGRG